MKKTKKITPRIGRPPLPPEEKRGEKRIPVRVTVADLARLKDIASKSGKTIAEFVRERLGL